MKTAKYFIALGIMLSASAAQADLLVYEGFEGYYKSGNNTTYNGLNDGGTKYIRLNHDANGGVGWKSKWTSKIPVMEKTMSKAGVKSSANGYWRGGDTSYREIATGAGSNMAKAGMVKSNGKIGAVGKTLFISFLWSFERKGGWGGFSLFNNTGNSKSRSEIAYFGKQGSNWGFSHNGLGDASRTTNTGNRAFNIDNNNASFQTNPDLIVMKLEFKSDKTEITAWINPNTNKKLSDNGNIKTASDKALEFDGIRLASGGGHNNVDEIRMGTNYKSVLGVPEPATIALLAFGGVGLLRKRKKSA